MPPSTPYLLTSIAQMSHRGYIRRYLPGLLQSHQNERVHEFLEELGPYFKKVDASMTLQKDVFCDLHPFYAKRMMRLLYEQAQKGSYRMILSRDLKTDLISYPHTNEIVPLYVLDHLQAQKIKVINDEAEIAPYAQWCEWNELMK